MNDTTIIRTYQDMITTRTVAHAAADPNNCAVLIWTFRFNHRLPGLRTALAGEGYELVDAWRPDKQLWVKHACEGPK